MFGRGKKKDKAKPPKPPKAKKEKKAKAKKKAKPPKAKKPKGPVKKRPTDVYAVLLMLSTAFVLLSVVFLTLALSDYGFPSNTMTPPPPNPRTWK